METNADTMDELVGLQAITLRNQQASPLLRLPAEVRNEIYGYVLGGHEIEMCGRSECSYCHLVTMPDTPTVHYPRSLLNILGVSRQLHQEARLLPFSSNAFFGAPENFAFFFTEHFTAAQVAAIESVRIRLYMYGCSWDEVARVKPGSEMMKGLEALRRVLKLKSIVLVWCVGDEEDEDPRCRGKRFETKLVARVGKAWEKLAPEKKAGIEFLRYENYWIDYPESDDSDDLESQDN